MAITPYLHFNDTCREAMTTYQSILGGQLDIMLYSDMAGGPPEFATSTRIMHSALMSPFGDLQGSDNMPGTDGPDQQSVSVHIEVPQLADGERIFAGLAQGGIVKIPFGPAHFTEGFGMATDRFGAHWIVSVTARG